MQWSWCLVFVIALGMVVCQKSSPAVTWGRGSILLENPAQPPPRGHTYSFPEWGPVAYPTLLTGTQPRDWCISKNCYMCLERPVHQRLRMLRTLTVTLDAIPSVAPRPRPPEDVHQQPHASRCPHTLNSPAPRQPPSFASLVML